VTEVQAGDKMATVMKPDATKIAEAKIPAMAPHEATILGARQILKESGDKLSATYDGKLLVNACRALLGVVAAHSSKETEAALKKFAAIADLYDPAEDDTFDIWCDCDLREIRSLRLGDFRMMRTFAAEIAARKAAAGVQDPAS
jgi:hypothetical protein